MTCGLKVRPESKMTPRLRAVSFTFWERIPSSGMNDRVESGGPNNIVSDLVSLSCRKLLDIQSLMSERHARRLDRAPVAPGCNGIYNCVSSA